MGRTHRTAGVVFTMTGMGAANALFHVGLTLPDLAAAGAIGLIAAEFPDLDHPESSITHGKVSFASVAPRWIRSIARSFASAIPFGRSFLSVAKPAMKVFVWIVMRPAVWVGLILRQMFGHRGPTHSLGFLVLWSLLTPPLYLVFVSGLLGLFSLVHRTGQSFSSEVHQLTAFALSHYALVAAAVALGYLSHLVMDGFTNVPLPFLWPLSQRRSWLLPRALRVTTDSAVENWIVYPATFVALVAACVFAFSTGAHVPPVQAQMRAAVTQTSGR